MEIRNGSDQVLKQHVWGLDYIDELVEVKINQDPQDTSEEVCERPFYALHNAQYNVLGLLQPVYSHTSAYTVTGQHLVERYEYTPYGEREVYSHGWSITDITGDGNVDASDYSAWQLVSLNGQADSVADVNGDGQVDTADRDMIIDGMLYGHSGPQNDPLVLTRTHGTARGPRNGSLITPLNTIGHQGLSHDEETNLIYNRARHLHPTLGRFIQRDKLGYIDGINVYMPYHLLLRGYDPSGLAVMELDDEDKYWKRLGTESKFKDWRDRYDKRGWITGGDGPNFSNSTIVSCCSRLNDRHGCKKEGQRYDWQEKLEDPFTWYETTTSWDETNKTCALKTAEYQGLYVEYRGEIKGEGEKIDSGCPEGQCKCRYKLRNVGVYLWVESAGDSVRRIAAKDKADCESKGIKYNWPGRPPSRPPIARDKESEAALEAFKAYWLSTNGGTLGPSPAPSKSKLDRQHEEGRCHVGP